jgi:hypothetical protein
VAVTSRRRKFLRGEAADATQKRAVEGVLEARRAGGIWGLVRWVSSKVSGAQGLDDFWVRLLHMSADSRGETRRLLGSRPRLPPAAPTPTARVGERRSVRVAALAAGVAAGAAAGGRVAKSASDSALDSNGEGTSSVGAEGEVALEGTLVAEVRE